MDRAESEILVPTTPEETWEAITDPERLAEWLATDVELELEPGGELTVTVDDEQRNGFVEEISEPRRFVFWWSTGEAESSRVEIELEPEVDGTRVRVVESRPLSVLGTTGARTPELSAVG